MKLKKRYFILIVIFGIFCFLCGFLYSNFLIKTRQNTDHDQNIKYHSGLINSSLLIVSNSSLSFKIIDDILKVWRCAIEDNKNFNLVIQNYLYQERDTLNKLKYFNKEIENELLKLKVCPTNYLESHIALMDIFALYSQMFSLAKDPQGSLLEFSDKSNELIMEFTKKLSYLKIYLPELNQLLSDRQQEAADGFKKSLVASSSIDGFDQILKKGMNLSIVEKMIGVPKEKRRDCLKREVWVYPSKKTGLYNRVYFIDDKVSDWR